MNDAIECPFYTVRKQRSLWNDPSMPIEGSYIEYNPQCSILKSLERCPNLECYIHTCGERVG